MPTVDGQSDDKRDSRSDAVDRLHHVVTGILATHLAHVQRPVLQSLHVCVADDHLEVLAV